MEKNTKKAQENTDALYKFSQVLVISDIFHISLFSLL